MKKLLLSVAALGCFVSAHAQTNTLPTSGSVGIGTTSPSNPLTVNGTIGIYGSGIDGSLFQRSVIYSDLTNGFLFDAAKNSSNQRLNIAFGWRGEPVSTPGLFIQGASGNIGLGTNAPYGKLHLVSPTVNLNSSGIFESNLHIQGTSTSKSTTKGAAIGFSLPGNTDGSNIWEQGKILVTSDNTSNGDIQGRMYLQTRYYNATQGAWVWRNNLVLRPNGSVGIGTESTGSYALAVEGKIGAREIQVQAPGSPWADYVFENTYQLRPLSEVEKYVQENKHLPEVPSAAEVEKNGINLGEMDALLLKKVEELTLYMIELKKENQALKQEVESLKRK